MQNTENELAYVLLTSGSTGKPKTVMQTQEGLYEQMMRYYRMINIHKSSEEHFADIAPLFHDQGIVDIFAALLHHNSSLYLYDFNLSETDFGKKTLFTNESG